MPSSSTAARAADVTRGQRDLDTRRQEPSARPLVGRRLRERGVEHLGGTLRIPLREPDERHRGLWRSALGMRLAKCRLGTSEVAPQAPDVADGIPTVRLRWHGVVAVELMRRSLELLFRPFPGATDGGDLGPMDPADARESRERLSFAVALGRLDPLRGALVVRQVPARPDGPTRGDPGGERRSSPFTADTVASSMSAMPSEVSPVAIFEFAQVAQGVGPEIGVLGSLADGDGLFRLLEGAIDVPHRARALTPDEGEVAVDVRVAARADECSARRSHTAAIARLPW